MHVCRERERGTEIASVDRMRPGKDRQTGQENGRMGSLLGLKH